MDSCYIPNNPQYGLQLEYTAYGGGNTVNINGSLTPYNGTSLTCGNNHNNNSGVVIGGDPLSPCNVTTSFCTGLTPSSTGIGQLSPTTSCNDPNTLNAANGYWSTADDMGSFSLPSLDLDPLPSLFPFSPCSTNNYKSECVSNGGIIGGGGSVHHQGVVKQPHDMADVLLSLKHAVVHPGQTSGGGGASGAVGSIGACASLSPGAAAVYPQQPQLSYSVHPHQMLMSPSSYTGGFCDQGTMFGANTGGCQGHQSTGSAAMFPSMSVNVSMNMTMHGYPPAYPDTLQHQVNCPQMQWGASPQATSPVYQQCQSGGLLSPGYAGGATYSFTADFRSPGAVCEAPLITASSSFKPVLTSNGGKTASFSPMSGLRPRRQSLSGYPTTPLSSGGKVHTGALSSEDESQRPNLCRICGKTYARPSTLKTHLRTHSGEKPYRCADCNKSFSQAANLTAHVRTHSGEKPFRCPICDRRFSQSSSVTTHMRTHSGERPYRCRMCKKAFSDSSTLTKHLRIHSGEKPYQCKLCLLRFSQSGNLNRHMRVHGSNNPMIG